MALPNSVPRFVGQGKTWDAQLSAANTNRDGTGTIVDFMTAIAAGMPGIRVTAIRIVATGTTTAGVIRIFIHDGTGYRLYKEIMVTAVTPSTSQEVFNSDYVPPAPIELAAGEKLGVSTHNAETFQAFAHGGEF